MIEGTLERARVFALILAATTASAACADPRVIGCQEHGGAYFDGATPHMIPAHCAPSDAIFADGFEESGMGGAGGMFGARRRVMGAAPVS